MKATVVTADMATALAWISPPPGARPVADVRTGVLRIQTERNKLLLRAHDLPMDLACAVASNIQEPGGVEVRLQVLRDLAALYPNGSVSLWTEKNSLHLDFPTGHNTIPILDGTSLASLPPHRNVGASIPARALAALMAAAAPVASEELAGDRARVFLSASGGAVEALASNGVVGARATARVDDDLALQIAVGARVALKLAQLASVPNANAGIAILENRVSLAIGGRRVVFPQTTAGAIPWPRVQTPGSSCKLERRALKDRLQAVAILSNTGDVDIDLHFARDGLRLQTHQGPPYQRALLSGEVQHPGEKISLTVGTLNTALEVVKEDIVKIDVVEADGERRLRVENCTESFPVQSLICPWT